MMSRQFRPSRDFPAKRYSTAGGGVTNSAGSTVAPPTNQQVRQAQNRGMLSNSPGNAAPRRRRMMVPVDRSQRRIVGRDVVTPVQNQVVPANQQPVASNQQVVMTLEEQERLKAAWLKKMQMMQQAQQNNQAVVNNNQLSGISPVETAPVYRIPVVAQNNFGWWNN